MHISAIERWRGRSLFPQRVAPQRRVFPLDHRSAAAPEAHDVSSTTADPCICALIVACVYYTATAWRGASRSFIWASAAQRHSVVGDVDAVYYSMYGHQAKMAAAIKEGVDSVDGVEGVLYQVAETLSDEVLGKMGAPPKNADIPVLDPNDLAKAGAPLACLRALCAALAGGVKLKPRGLGRHVKLRHSGVALAPSPMRCQHLLACRLIRLSWCPL
jgi:hypothetical protein